MESGMRTSDLAAEVRGLCEELEARISRTDGRIIAIAMVRNEEDVVERFARHCLIWADALLIVDHASCDETPIILHKLIDEGLCLGVVHDSAVGKHQADRMTMLAKAAAIQLSAHVIVPLDADEFLVHECDGDIRDHLSSMPKDSVTVVHWQNYVPMPIDSDNEIDILRRITHRTAEPSQITKSIIGGEVAAKEDFRIGHGSHWIFSEGMRIYGNSGICKFYLAHFPVRSAGQIAAKTLMTPLAGMLDLERFPSAQQHYSRLQDRVRIHSYMSAVELQSAAENFADYERTGRPDFVHDPVKDTSGPLRYTPLNRVDAAHRLAQFARGLVEKLLSRPDGAGEAVAIRELISAENDRLWSENDQMRQEINSLRVRLAHFEERFSALRRIKIFRVALWIRRGWKRSRS